MAKFFSASDRDSMASQIAISVQQTGFLEKKRFSKAGKQGPWQKRFFVLKDGFLLWYSDKPKKNAVSQFDPHPKGCLPLGGCTIVPIRGTNKKGVEENRAFEISHPDFNGSLLLAAEDEAQAADWRRVLNDARRVTWENAILGDAFIDQLEAKGTELQKQAAEALERAQQDADRVRKELEEKRKLQQRTRELEGEAMEAKMKHEEIDSIAKAKQAELEEQRKRAEEFETKAEEERQKRSEEEMKRAKVEKQLKEAEATLLKLEKALKMTSKKSVDDEISVSVNSLKQFFHDKIEEQKIESQTTDAIREGLTEKVKYKQEFNRTTTKMQQDLDNSIIAQCD